MVIRAVFENGVFTPVAPVSLPERCTVEFEPRIVTPAERSAALSKVYEILSRRYDGGESDIAARHNEHQP
jgi:predicted DNA-binding antitoxin AbrB/MazE fold protein